MQKLKRLARRAIKPVCFILCALLLIAAADAVLCPKSDTMAAFYAEPKDSIDVLFVGGSHGAAAFDPIQMWQQQGFTSYNLFSWGQPAWTSYHYTVEVLKRQKPKVVVLEGFGLMYGNSYLEEANFDDVSDDYSLLMRPSLNRLQLALAMSRNQQNHRPVYQYASLLRYHNRWQIFEPGFLGFFFEDHTGTAKGFGPNYTTEPFPQNAVVENAPPAALYPGCEEYLYKMIELSKKEGFELVVATAPYVIEQDSEYGVLRRIADICAENGVACLDYNLAPGAEAGIDFATDLAEHAHVNLYGAQKLSAHIGAYLDDRFDLPDRRGQAPYAHWEAAAEVELRDKEKMRLMMSQGASAYLKRLAGEGFTAFIASKGSLAGTDSAAVAEGFEALGLPTGVFTGGAGAMLAVLDGGELVTAEQGARLAAEHSVGPVQVRLSTDGDSASFLVDGQETARSYDGILILVLHRDTGEYIQSIALDAADGYAIKTD